MDLVAFLGVSIAVILTPGQDTALTVKNTLRGGLRGGVHTAIGVVTGQAVWAVAAGLGVAAVLVASEVVFFTSLFPQFAPRDAGLAGMLVLGLLFSAMTLLWLSFYAFAVSRAGDALRDTGVRRALDGLIGAVLVWFGVRLATEQR